MRVLNVDDNANNRLIIELLLEEFDEITQIDEAEDGLEAIARCKEDHYDLIFMDIMMPKLDGLEATKEIHAFAKSTMIIAVTAMDTDESKRKMLENGAEDYIVKPINDELFKQRVKNYLSIVSMRYKTIYNNSKHSLYDEKVYPLVKSFTIESEESLAYFWDYILNKSEQKSEEMSDVVRVIYGIGLWILKTKFTTTIHCEENEDTQFITLRLSPSISEHITHNILLKHDISDHLLKMGLLSFRLPKTETQVIHQKRSIDKKDKEILDKSHLEEKVSADDFFETVAVDYLDKVESLEDVETQIFIELDNLENHPDDGTLKSISEYYMYYFDTLTRLMKFEDLAHAVKSISMFLKTLHVEEIDAKDLHRLVESNIHLVDDLTEWRQNLFVHKSVDDIHYLDASLMSSCLQIESIFHKEDLGEDIEFF